MQEVFFCRDGATESVSMTFKGSVPLDSVVHHLGVATGSLQLQTRAGHFSATAPGESWTLGDLRFLCGPTAGTTAGSPIVVRPAPSAGEPEPWSAELNLAKACFRVITSPKPNCELDGQTGPSLQSCLLTGRWWPVSNLKDSLSCPYVLDHKQSTMCATVCVGQLAWCHASVERLAGGTKCGPAIRADAGPEAWACK